MASVSTILKNLYAANKPANTNPWANIGTSYKVGTINTLGDVAQLSANKAAAANAPAPAPAAPAPSTPPVDKSKLNPVTGLPWDSQYESTVGGINRDRDFNLGNLDFDFGKTASRLGFTTTGGFDPTDPFSRAALLKRSFDQRKDFTTNSMAARGQLYSGAIGRARAEDQHGYDVGYDSLQKVYDDAFQAYIRGRTGVTNAAAAGVVTAQGDAIARAPAADPLTAPNILNADGSPKAPAASLGTWKGQPIQKRSSDGKRYITVTRDGWIVHDYIDPDVASVRVQRA